jgi:hypothetical protein
MNAFGVAVVACRSLRRINLHRAHYLVSRSLSSLCSRVQIESLNGAIVIILHRLLQLYLPP